MTLRLACTNRTSSSSRSVASSSTAVLMRSRNPELLHVLGVDPQHPSRKDHMTRPKSSFRDCFVDGHSRYAQRACHFGDT